MWLCRRGSGARGGERSARPALAGPCWSAEGLGNVHRSSLNCSACVPKPFIVKESAMCKGRSCVLRSMGCDRLLAFSARTVVPWGF